MQQLVLDVFTHAVREVFAETGIEIDTIDEGEIPPGEEEVITTIGLTGDLKGILMLRTDAESVDGILRAMTGGMGVTLQDDRYDDIQMAAFGELSNQVCGRAITLLWERKVRCDITPPAILAARQLRTLVTDLSTSYRRIVRGPFGRLTLFLGLQAAEAPDSRKKN